jgi:hypothetical protein
MIDTASTAIAAITHIHRLADVPVGNCATFCGADAARAGCRPPARLGLRALARVRDTALLGFAVAADGGRAAEVPE